MIPRNSFLDMDAEEWSRATKFEEKLIKRSFANLTGSVLSLVSDIEQVDAAEPIVSYSPQHQYLAPYLVWRVHIVEEEETYILLL